jgi:hypothetical protein
MVGVQGCGFGLQGLPKRAAAVSSRAARPAVGRRPNHVRKESAWEAGSGVRGGQPRRRAV